SPSSSASRGGARSRSRAGTRRCRRARGPDMDTRIQIVAIAGALALLVGVLELVRRRRFLERYALLWLAAACVLLALAIWRGALARISEALGIAYPPNAL